MRTIITMDDKDASELEKLCHHKGWSRAKGIREAVKTYLQNQKIYEKKEVFGIWKDRSIDGLQYEESLRSEW